MRIFSIGFNLLVVLIHCFIFMVEVFKWDKPLGLKMFKLEQDFATKTRVMAINQGWYNLFLAGGVLFAFIVDNPSMNIYFLACVVIAGGVGAITSNIIILFVQAIPALCAIISLLLGI